MDSSGLSPTQNDEKEGFPLNSVCKNLLFIFSKNAGLLGRVAL